MKIVISRTADNDLMTGYRFYKDCGQEVGDYFLDSLISDIDSLALFAGFIEKSWLSCGLEPSIPLCIYYKIEGDVVRVRRVLDCRQNPDWIRAALKRG